MAEFYMPEYKYKPPTEEQVLRHLADMSYKSPIEVFSQGVKMKLEGDVVQAIQSYGISVDKDELVKALQYDRDQYKKGFADGCRCRTDTIKAEVAMEIFEDIEGIIEASEYELLDDFGDPIAKCHNERMIIDDIAELKKKYTEEKV